MGMFDNLKIKSDLLPISDEEKKFLGLYHDWQTKDFDCILSTAEITDDGKLRFRSFKYGWDEEAENSFGRKGALVERNQQWIEYNEFTGAVCFYSLDKNNDWWQFYALFDNGQLTEIKGGKEED